MKKAIQFVLQHVLGFRNYLFVFSLYIFYTLKRNRKEGDFLHFLSMLSDGTTVLDIGANIGVMTAHIARRFPQGNVLAFEPVPDNVLTIRRIIRFFKLTNVKVFDFALGNSEGEATIILPVLKKVKMQGLSHIAGATGDATEKGREYRVAMHRIDRLAELQHPELPVSGIKIDVENYESKVLEGASGLIRKYRPVIYAELWEGQNRADCFGLLQGFGYSVKVLESGKLVTFDPARHTGQNFFFVPAAG